MCHKIHSFEVHNSVVFSIFPGWCNHHNNLILGHFYHSPPKEISLSHSLLQDEHLPTIVTDLLMLKIVYSRPSISMGSASVGLTKHRSKILGKKLHLY